MVGRIDLMGSKVMSFQVARMVSFQSHDFRILSATELQEVGL